MDYEELNILYQSRKTLLKILASRGYVTTSVEKFGPVEIEAMASAGAPALRMDLEKSQEALTAAPSPIKKCTVLYTFNRIKNRIASFLGEIFDEDGLVPEAERPSTEIIVVTLEPIVEAFHTAALQTLRGRKGRISFFQAHTIVNNPMEHVLVPRHEPVPSSEHAALLQRLKIRSKENLPLIRFHEDMMARLLGLLPEDIVKITRPSPQAGEYETYRVCVP